SLALAGRLHPRDAQGVQERLGLRDHVAGEVRGLLRLAERLLLVALLQGLLQLGLGLRLALDALLDGGALQLGGLAVEDVDRTDAGLRQVRRAVEEPGEVARDAPLLVLQRRAVGLADAGEELVERVVGVDGDGLPLEILERARRARHDVREVDAHGGAMEGPPEKGLSFLRGAPCATACGARDGARSMARGRGGLAPTASTERGRNTSHGEGTLS